MEPLDRETSFAEIRKALVATNEALVAAPYFGEGAVGALNLSRVAKLTVVCDLFSGACNPQEIRKIMALPQKPKVMTLAGLHAKIYLTPNEVVIGSANPSANGLSFEGAEVVGNIEACLKIDEDFIVDQWKMFADKEIIAKASMVTLSDIKRAIPIWLRRRNQRENNKRDFLDCLKLAPEALRDRRIYIWLYERIDPNKTHYDLLDKERSALNDRDLDMYCDWEDIQRDDIIVDFSFSKRSRGWKFGGVWKVFDGRIIRRNKSSIFLVKKERSVGGMPLPSRDVKALQETLLRRFPISRRPDETFLAFDFSKML